MSVLSIQKHFPFVPDYMSWDDWNGNLAIFYGEFNIIFTDEIDWRTTADSVSSITAFAPHGVPSSEGYSDWQSWARDFTEIVNGQSY